MFFATNPVLTYFMPMAVALLAGPVYLLLIAKVQKFGAITIMGILMGIIWFVTGMYWGWAIACVICGIIADFIAGFGRYTSKSWNVVSYIINTLSPMGSYLMMWINQQKYIDYLTGKGTEQSYMDTMVKTASNWLLPVMLGGTVICALISALFGLKLLKKQFEKAGITA
jgi:energy-coupling factor transport system substrate-specific component